MGSFAGSCHCGALEFTFETACAPRQWSVRACQCAFCRAHASLSGSDPQGRLEFFEREAGMLVRYRFGQRTADFLICRRCGVYVGATIETPEGRFGIINVRALREVPLDLPAPQPMDYSGEDVATRTARRTARWTPLR